MPINLLSVKDLSDEYAGSMITNMEKKIIIEKIKITGRKLLFLIALLLYILSVTIFHHAFKKTTGRHFMQLMPSLD